MKDNDLSFESDYTTLDFLRESLLIENFNHEPDIVFFF